MTGAGPVGGVAFDYSGVYLAVGGASAQDGASLHVRAVKEWAEVAVSALL